MKASEKLYTIIKHYESLHDGDSTMVGLQPKLCPAGVWTEGYGRAMRTPDGKFIKGQNNKDLAYRLITIHTEHEATKCLMDDVAKREKAINNILFKHRVNVSQDIFDALVDIVYNCGISVLVDNLGNRQKVLNALINCDYEALYIGFALWVNSNNKKLPGLVARRKTEITLMQTGDVIFYN